MFEAMSDSVKFAIKFLLIISLIITTDSTRRVARQGFQFESSAPSSSVQSCRISSSQTGECIEILKCPEAAAILAGNPTPAQRRFLIDRTCRFDRAAPFFCCAKSGGITEAPKPPTEAPTPPTEAPTPPTVPTTPSTVAPPVVEPVTQPPVITEPITTSPTRGSGEASQWTLAKLNEVCGISKAPLTRVVGGQESELEYWPWMAALFVAENGVKTFSFVSCGGVLISDRYVLTAAHCIVIKATGQTRSPSDVTVRLGELDISKDDDGATPLDLEAEQLIPHPEYNPTTIKNDIALVKLPRSVEFTKLILPICLPTPEMESDTFEGMRPHIAGWGTVEFQGESSSILRHVQIQVTSNSGCQEAYRRFRITISPSQLCAGFQLGGKDACQGDSGGPLMLPKSRKWTTIGVVSVGFRCAERGFPGIYSRTTFYLDWIKKNTQLE